MNRVGLCIVMLLAIGCGPSSRDLREQTLSTLNTEADRWDGGNAFATTAVDAYGNPVTSNVRKTTLNYVLEIRSFGLDGLPKNSDDVVVTRSKPHKETTATEEASKVAEKLSESAAGGAIKGIRKGLGLGGKDK